MSDMLAEGGHLQVDPASVDESLDEGTPTDSITSKTISTVDTIPPQESMASSTLSNSSAQNVADAFDEIPTEKPTALPPLSAKGPQNVVDTLTTVSGFFPRLIAPITRRPRSKKALIITLLLFSLLLAGTFIPAILTLNYALNAYTTYTTLHDRAYSGVQHLLNVKTIFTGVSAHPTGFLDMSKLHRAQKEFVEAHNDFQQVQYTLDHAAIISTVTEYLPQYRPQITAAHATSKIGIDVTDIGQELVKTAMTLAPTFRGPLLNDTHAPLITPAMLTLVRSTIDYILPRLSDIQAQSATFSFNSLPVSQRQRDQLTQLIQAMPQAKADLMQVRGLLDAVGWMLGVDHSRTFLVQTMDRAELRPTGGFTGQFGELSITGGRVAPFALKDISLVEYTTNSPTLGLLAPPQYRSWWPFANWGLRDSNLSADFPTSAQIAIDKYKGEVGHPVDGVIMFTPFLIEHILQVVGPIQVPGYNDTITAQNIEERLHYYQQDNSGLAKQVIFQPGDKTTSSRKRFTALLAHLLMDRVRHAPPDEILTVARQTLHDLKTKDLQIYVTNPQVEQLLVKFGDAAQVDRSPFHDGLYVVQANVSASKASQYVRTILHDTVTLNSTGGATHVLQMRLVYDQLGPVYGYDTYHDYVRVYVPPASKYLWGDGFDTGVPLCGAYLGNCPRYDVYPRDELLCPAGLFQPGAQAPSIADEDGGRWHPLDTVGPPTNFTSDEPGRNMFGGLVIVPKNCTMTVTLSWYVPPSGPNNPYALLVQRQAGTFPELDLTILPTPGNCGILDTSGLHFDGVLGEDTSFSLKKISPTEDTSAGCYPQPGV